MTVADQNALPELSKLHRVNHGRTVAIFAIEPS